MEIVLSPKAKRDLEFWTRSGNKKVLKKIADLIREIQNNPYEGVGKPEALKYDLSGKWSRRIDREHRLIYQITDADNLEILNILSLKGHYE
ncbi:MAG: Txe/YoeB family addiction module toxin [Chryseobacterium sp.]|nr:MAG: Txe/YoeB family addiction module toxin [Chryseobacterium sp.]